MFPQCGICGREPLAHDELCNHTTAEIEAAQELEAMEQAEIEASQPDGTEGDIFERCNSLAFYRSF